MVFLALWQVALCLLVASWVHSDVLAESTGVSRDLSLLCANDPAQGQVNLKLSSQVKALVLELKSSSKRIKCPQRIVSALEDLNWLIEQNANNVCTLEATGRIRNYYDTYIAATLDTTNECEASKDTSQEAVANDELPKALKDFFLAYGLQVSGLCKLAMIPTLEDESKFRLTKKDFELIAPLTGENSVISQVMSDPSDYDDILIPRDLDQVLKSLRGQKPTKNEKLHIIQRETGPMMERTKALCGRRFKPIYEQLILPVLYLSNMGFNYQGQKLGRELEEIRLNKELHQWYRIVFICESVGNIELVEDPEDAKLTADMDRRRVRIVSPEEAATIAKLNHQAKNARDDAKEEDEFISTLEQIDYELPDGNQLEDEILDESDEYLIETVNSFDVHKTELDNLQAKLIQKLKRYVLDSLKRGEFKFLFGGVWKMIKGDGEEHDANQQSSANDLLFEQINSYVNGQYETDSPVGRTTFTKYCRRKYNEVSVMRREDYTNIASKGLDAVTVSTGVLYSTIIVLFFGCLYLLLFGG